LVFYCFLGVLLRNGLRSLKKIEITTGSGTFDTCSRPTVPRGVGRITWFADHCIKETRGFFADENATGWCLVAAELVG
jgi:hypothetical protein